MGAGRDKNASTLFQNCAPSASSSCADSGRVVLTGRPSPEPVPGSDGSIGGVANSIPPPPPAAPANGPGDAIGARGGRCHSSPPPYTPNEAGDGRLASENAPADGAVGAPAREPLLTVEVAAVNPDGAPEPAPGPPVCSAVAVDLARAMIASTSASSWLMLSGAPEKRDMVGHPSQRTDENAASLRRAMRFLDEGSLCGQGLLELVARGSAIIAELLRLAEHIPGALLPGADPLQGKYLAVLFDFRYAACDYGQSPSGQSSATACSANGLLLAPPVSWGVICRWLTVRVRV